MDPGGIFRCPKDLGPITGTLVKKGTKAIAERQSFFEDGRPYRLPDR
jgi:hypothetical protein